MLPGKGGEKNNDQLHQSHTHTDVNLSYIFIINNECAKIAITQQKNGFGLAA